jgi:hypothetical protein
MLNPNIAIIKSKIFNFCDMADHKTTYYLKLSQTIDVYKYGNDTILYFKTIDEYIYFYTNVLSTHAVRFQLNNVSNIYSDGILRVQSSGKLMFSIAGINIENSKVTFTTNGNTIDIPKFNEETDTDLFDISKLRKFIDLEFNNGTCIENFLMTEGYVLNINVNETPNIGIISIENLTKDDYIDNFPSKLFERIMVIY